MDWGIYIIALLFGGAIIAFLFKIFSQVNERLNQMQQTIQEANKIIGQNLGNATVTFGNVMEQLGRLEETNREVLEISKEISALQDLLKVPKFRGGMGETFLENLLSQVLPAGYYTMQYRFQSSDTVDAVVKLGERLVPIDAKFSLENFQKTLESGDEQTKSVYRKRFIQDVKNRI
ncbi:MAG: DNA recombination protein RmuC, partial [Candidatus Omnitrophica bacterium]|nr:DNA recombination protein RmuC [Candidatus Omnitrophota bacterium]